LSTDVRLDRARVLQGALTYQDACTPWSQYPKVGNSLHAFSLVTGLSRWPIPLVGV